MMLPKYEKENQLKFVFEAMSNLLRELHVGLPFQTTARLKDLL